MLRMCQLVPGGEAKITKLFIWKKVGSLPRVTLPSKRVTLHPGSPCPPSQLCNFSYKRFAAIYKEMYEKLSHPGWLGMEGNPPTRDNSPPYKQALSDVWEISGVKHPTQTPSLFAFHTHAIIDIYNISVHWWWIRMQTTSRWHDLRSWRIISLAFQIVIKRTLSRASLQKC